MNETNLGHIIIFIFMLLMSTSSVLRISNLSAVNSCNLFVCSRNYIPEGTVFSMFKLFVA